MVFYLFCGFNFVECKAHRLLDAISGQIQRSEFAFPLLVIVLAQTRELKLALLGALALYLRTSHCGIAAAVGGFRLSTLGGAAISAIPSVPTILVTVVMTVVTVVRVMRVVILFATALPSLSVTVTIAI